MKGGPQSQFFFVIKLQIEGKLTPSPYVLRESSTTRFADLAKRMYTHALTVECAQKSTEDDGFCLDLRLSLQHGAQALGRARERRDP